MVFSPERAMSLMCNGQLDSAIRLFNRALRDEKRVDLFALRAEAYYLKGDFERSLKDYSSAIDFEDENPQLYCNRAVIYTKLGRVFYAIADYTRALNIDPCLEWALLNRGSLNCSLGRLPKAVQDLSRALQLNVSLLQAYDFRASAYSELGSFELAKRDIETAIGMMPDDPMRYAGRAFVFAKAGAFDACIADFTHVIDSESKGQAFLYNWRAWAYKQKGNFRLCEADLNRAIELQKEDVSSVLYINRAEARLLLNEVKGAYADLMQAIILEPLSANANMLLGETCWRMKKLGESAQALTRALELDPTIAGAHRLRGRVFLQMEEFEFAVSDFRMALAENKDDPEAKQFLREAKFYLMDFKKHNE